MRYYIYIILTGNFFHVGYSSDIEKAIDFYKKLPNMYLKDDLHKLVYLEEVRHETEAMLRFAEITAYPKDVKEIMIETVNPDYLDLIPGENIEL